MVFSGTQVISKLEGILSDLEQVSHETCEDLKLKTVALIRRLQVSPKNAHWANVINFQFQDLKHFFKKHANKSSSQLTTPQRFDVSPSNTYVPFTPLVDVYSKISCDIQNCDGRFSHKRSYELHVTTLHGHDGFQPDPTKRDPLGTCRLISRKTRKECGTKLPLK